jgi:hypothetical protein
MGEALPMGESITESLGSAFNTPTYPERAVSNRSGKDAVVQSGYSWRELVKAFKSAVLPA